MGKSSRTKGAGGELELCRIFGAQLGIRAVRNLDQTRAGGIRGDILQDVDGVVEAFPAGFVVECKRSAGRFQAGWWVQAKKQAKQAKGIPALCYRQDRGQWAVRLRGSDLVEELKDESGAWVEMGLEDFCTVVRERMLSEAEGAQA